MRPGESRFRFKTHRDGFALTTGLVVDRRTRRDGAPHDELADLAGIANAGSHACAFGKIAVIAADGIHSFQVMPDGRISPVFCGNSTAAAIRSLGLTADHVSRVHGPGAITYPLLARATGDTISQNWTVPPPIPEQIIWRGRRVVLIRTLNDYAIVLGDLAGQASPHSAREELLGLLGSAKLAVVEPQADAPLVRFYNANGRHGAAPQTGLGSIALAAAQIDWLGEMFAPGQVSFMTSEGMRTTRLPALRSLASGAIELSLDPIAVEIAALDAMAAA
jgi:hypothetical protein